MTMRNSHKLWTGSSLGTLLVMSTCLLGVFAACDGSGDNAGGKYGAAGGAASEDGTPSEGGAASPEATNNAGATGDDLADAGGAPACVPQPPTLPTDVPAMIQAPDGVTLVRHFHAVGTQNYRCSQSAGAYPTYSWVFIGPVADLLNSCGKKVGSHFAVPQSDPPQPEWRYDVDGSSVSGTKVDASPVDGAIPELLLKQAGHSDSGVFSTVTFVQRLATAGGAAPAAGDCNAGHVDEEQDVGYTAEYYFYSGGT